MPLEPTPPPLQTIRGREAVPTEADALTAEETEELAHTSRSHQLEISAKIVALEKQIAELRSYNLDVDERRRFALRVFRLTCAWLTIVMLVVLANGFGTACLIRFRLSDSVVLGLIGSTTANIVGVFLVVVNYLFPKQSGK